MFCVLLDQMQTSENNKRSLWQWVKVLTLKSKQYCWLSFSFRVCILNNAFIYSTDVLLEYAMKRRLPPLHKKFRHKRGNKVSSDFLSYLFQVVELHGYFSEEEVDVRSPLHGTHKIGLCVVVEKEHIDGSWEITHPKTSPFVNAALIPTTLE